MRARFPKTRLVVLSGSPASTRAQHGVEAWSRDPAAVWRALRGARLLISGGGSLVQDVTSPQSALYYLGVMAAAIWMRVPVVVVGQGVGPLRRTWIRRLAAWTFNRATAISVRDDESARLLAGIGVHRPVTRGADLAFLMQPAQDPAVAGAAHASTPSAPPSDAPRIGVAVRSWPGLAEPRSLARALRAVAGGSTVVPLVFDHRLDRPIAQAVAEGGGTAVPDLESPAALLAMIGAMDVVVGARLHALIMAVSQAVPAVGLAYDPKVVVFGQHLGLPVLPVTAPADLIAETVEETFGRRVEIRGRLRALLPALQGAAQASLDALIPWMVSPHAAGGPYRQELPLDGRK